MVNPGIPSIDQKIKELTSDPVQPIHVRFLNGEQVNFNASAYSLQHPTVFILEEGDEALLIPYSTIQNIVIGKK